MMGIVTYDGLEVLEMTKTKLTLLIVVYIAIGVVSAVLTGWILATVWRWVAVAEFGAPPISTVHGMLVYLCVIACSAEPEIDPEPGEGLDDVFWDYVIRQIGKPLMGLGIMWVLVYLFV